MAALAIDTMQLDVPGLSEPQARDLAHLVATGLAGATGLPDAANIPAIRLDLPHGAQTAGAPDVPGLARQIVAATLRAIDHAATGTP
ncbi:MAG TPA: hypothetical protein VMB34_19450 [Acetobacteraceae bacterium]|nr:hypothetical protein [Acetobacteraceae bacterium]